MPENSDIAVRQIRAKLIGAGSSLNAWAKSRGYNPRTVYLTVDTWAGRTDRQPHGGTAQRIMSDLRKDLGAEVVPEVVAERRDAA